VTPACYVMREPGSGNRFFAQATRWEGYAVIRQGAEAVARRTSHVEMVTCSSVVVV
jgi:hypothetical protein